MLKQNTTSRSTLRPFPPPQQPKRGLLILNSQNNDSTNYENTPKNIPLLPPGRSPDPIMLDTEAVKNLKLKQQQEEFSKLEIKTYEVPKEEISGFKLAKIIKEKSELLSEEKRVKVETPTPTLGQSLLAKFLPALTA